MQRVPPFASRRVACRGTSYIGYTPSLVGICHLIYHLHNNTCYAPGVYRHHWHDGICIVVLNVRRLEYTTKW